MSTESAALDRPDSGANAVIPADTLVGGRFRVERPARHDGLSEILFARDEKTRKPIAIRVLSADFAGDPRVFEAVREEIKAAAKLKHRSLVATYGVGTHGTDAHFIACEWVQGTALSEFIRRRSEAGKPLSVRGVYNVIAHVCKGIAAVHEGAAFHGALRPSVVWISKSGRVKVGDLGLGGALVSTGRWNVLPPEEQAFLAPEVRAGQAAGPQSDVWGVGALLYVLLTGRPPIDDRDDRAPPSAVHPNATAELDEIVRRCLSPDPSARYPTVGAIADALMPLVASAPEPTESDFDVDLEVDVDIAMSIIPSAPAPSASNPLAFAAAPTPPAPAPAATKSAGVDFSDLMAKLTKDDAARWMAVKGGLDHGPFTMRELVKLIVEGEILEEHLLFNMDTGERKALKEYPEFGEFIQQYRIRKSEKDHAVALQRSEKVEKRSNVAKFMILAGVLGAVAIGVTGYILTRQAAERRAARADEDLAALFESGQVKISGTADILKAPRGGARRGGKPGASGGPGASSGGGFTSYDDAMNQAMELNLNQAGGERQLSSEDVAGVMNRKLNSLFGCVGQELRGGGQLGTVRIDIAIMGSGQVMGASVNAGSPAFKQCISAKMRQIQFPSFPAPRMGARYSFDVD